MKTIDKKSLTLKTLNKSNIWDVQESDIFRMLEAAEKDADIKDNIRHYIDIVKSAFDLEEIKTERPEVAKKYEARGYKTGTMRAADGHEMNIAIKKRPIMRVTDLTYENIRHITAEKLMEVLDRNFGGGWDSLSQSIQDIIQSGFDISTTTLPKDRLHKPGGMYEKKVTDGFAVLEIPKGAWIEAIFAKLKPETEKPHVKYDEDMAKKYGSDDEDDDEDLPEERDTYSDPDDDDDFDEDKLTEESYRTTIEADPEDLDLAAEDVTDDDDY